MISITATVSCNTLEELFEDLETLLAMKPGAPALPAPPIAQQAAQPAPPPMHPAAVTAPAQPAQNVQNTQNTQNPQNTPPAPPPVQSSAPVHPAAPTANPVPTGAPSYTADDLAEAGGALLQTDKRDQVYALFPKYGVMLVHDLFPAQYGAFAPTYAPSARSCRGRVMAEHAEKRAAVLR